MHGGHPPKHGHGGHGGHGGHSRWRWRSGQRVDAAQGRLLPKVAQPKGEQHRCRLLVSRRGVPRNSSCGAPRSGSIPRRHWHLQDDRRLPRRRQPRPGLWCCGNSVSAPVLAEPAKDSVYACPADSAVTRPPIVHAVGAARHPKLAESLPQAASRFRDTAVQPHRAL
jgi:hypothetical protein